MLMVAVVNHEVENEPEWRWSEEATSIIHYFSATPADYKISIIRPKSTGVFNLKVEISDGQETLTQFDSHLEGAFLFDHEKDWVIYSQHSPIATGCTLVAFDLKAKRQVWKTNLKGIGAVAHSKWRNRINLKLEKDLVTVFGDEGRRYIESVSLESGKSTYHRMIDHIKFDGQEFEYRKLVELARGQQPFPVALTNCNSPGVLKDKKPWSGTFVNQSHKTELMIETYENGLRHGSSNGYHTPTIRHWTGEYVKGKLHGQQKTWDASGRLHSTSVYKHGDLISERQH